jgi:hypothetical protein
VNPKILPFGLILAGAAVCGCQQADPPAAAVATSETSVEAVDEARAPAQETWDASSSPFPGTHIEIRPSTVSFCDEKRQVVEVDWDMAAANPAQLQLWVEDAKGKRNLWVAAKSPASTKKTGNWATEGMKFIAVDAKVNTVLNSATIPATSCPGG